MTCSIWHSTVSHRIWFSTHQESYCWLLILFSFSRLFLFYVEFVGENFNNCAILDDYKIHEKIGEGGFGYVHLATNKETNKQVAVKFMDMTQTRK